MKKMISKSQLNRRIHRIEPTLWRVLLESFWPKPFKKRNDPDQTYAVDSLAVAVCDQHPHPSLPTLPLRDRRRILRPGGLSPPKRKSFGGYIASKRRYFYGFWGALGGERSGRAGGVCFGGRLRSRRRGVQGVRPGL